MSETPRAFVELKRGAELSEMELRDWCKERLVFKIPGKFMFEPIPKTSTGKVQKFLLRQRFTLS